MKYWFVCTNNVYIHTHTRAHTRIHKYKYIYVYVCGTVPNAFILFSIRAVVVVATHFSLSYFFTRYVHRCIHPCYCRFVFVRLKPSLKVVATSFNNQFYSIQSAQCHRVYFSVFLALSCYRRKLLLFFVVVVFDSFQNQPKSFRKSAPLCVNYYYYTHLRANASCTKLRRVY